MVTGAVAPSYHKRQLGEMRTELLSGKLTSRINWKCRTKRFRGRTSITPRPVAYSLPCDPWRCTGLPAIYLRAVIMEDKASNMSQHLDLWCVNLQHLWDNGGQEAEWGASSRPAS